MDINAAKINLAQKILAIQKESTIFRLNQLLQSEELDQDELQNSLDIAFNNMKEGEVKPHDEVKLKYAKWL